MLLNGSCKDSLIALSPPFKYELKTSVLPFLLVKPLLKSSELLQDV